MAKRGRVATFDSRPFRFPFAFICVGLNVPVLVKCEPDESNRQQDGARYKQPMWIFHLKRSQLSRRFSLLVSPHYIPRGACRAETG
jgi:hypothetical protein